MSALSGQPTDEGTTEVPAQRHFGGIRTGPPARWPFQGRGRLPASAGRQPSGRQEARTHRATAGAPVAHGGGLGLPSAPFGLTGRPKRREPSATASLFCYGFNSYSGFTSAGIATENAKKPRHAVAFLGWDRERRPSAPPKPDQAVQWNCSSSVEPVSALTLEEPPWMTVVTSSK